MLFWESLHNLTQTRYLAAKNPFGQFTFRLALAHGNWRARVDHLDYLLQEEVQPQSRKATSGGGYFTRGLSSTLLAAQTRTVL